MRKFGEIIKVKIPLEELRNGRTRMYGFAFVTYRTTEEAAKALAEREVNVEYATLEIEKALKRSQAPRDTPKVSEFEQLKRRT
jgi:RNA recognition motif-containing protein